MAKQSAQGTQEESRKRDAMQIIKHGTGLEKKKKFYFAKIAVHAFLYSLHSCSCLSTAEE